MMRVVTCWCMKDVHLLKWVCCAGQFCSTGVVMDIKCFAAGMGLWIRYVCTAQADNFEELGLILSVA